jgi:hypothetical protein
MSERLPPAGAGWLGIRVGWVRRTRRLPHEGVA